MKVSVNIKVRNSEWFELDDELKMINEGKMAKYSDFVDFEFDFEVISHIDNRSTDHALKLQVADNGMQSESIYILNDVTKIDFIGKAKQHSVVVSNSLIHSFLGAVQRGKRFYWYFFLKENTNYAKLGVSIWIDDAQIQDLLSKYPGARFETENNIKLRKTGGNIYL